MGITDFKRIADRYAGAAVSLAEEQKESGHLKSDCIDLLASLEKSEELQDFINAQGIGREQAVAVAAEISKKGKYAPIMQNLLSILAQNGRLNVLPHVLRAIMDLYSGEGDEIVAEVVSASTLTAKQTEGLQKSLGKSFGKNVQIVSRVDESVIGGVSIKIGSVMIDDTVKNKLNRLSQKMLDKKVA